ncbi:hypothetical protein QQF73_01520 [Marinobacter sp. M216]|uniref:Outer membrane protein beta-barrel domain-containing protein n=1 Tax=Marinobacter albus TaxID=3030833 RepID=A0ABT7H8B2_9GAMM|nr:MULTISPECIES: hypothetical protein [unclassified Marinobacter]MBW7471435.1 hypothetical protein [Marinobacter sp. F4218]MDK9556287.1 hypothetical protein [Marinobacter sp. M216]
MNRHILTTALFALTLTAPPVVADIGLSPFAGFRMSSSVNIQTAGASTEDQIDFRDSVSQGLALNFDLAEPGKQGELYFSRQSTSARLDNGLFASGVASIDLTIYQLQFGGLYFPAGKSHGGFVSGVLGVTRLEPEDSGYETHHRAALSLGGGYQFFLTEQLRLRLDLRGIYTALNSGGSAFCSGGCELRFDSSGYLQVEAGAGLVIRF